MDKYLYDSNEAFCITNAIISSNIISYLTDNEEISVLDKIESTIIGLYLADFAVALIHLFFDNYRGKNKFLQKVAYDFTEHHTNPTKLLSTPNLKILFQSSVTPFAILHTLFRPKSKKNKLTHLVFVYALYFTHLTHKAAHYINHSTKEEKESTIGQILQILQKNNIILSPESHKKHHTAKIYDVNFGLLNGWSHPVINEIVKIPLIHDFIYDSSSKSL